MTNTVNYSITKGLPWERLIMVRDQRTHRTIRAYDAWGLIKTSETGRMSITTTITGEGGIMLSLTEEETKDLPVGDLQYDVVADLPRRGSTTPVTRPVVKGTITVSALDTITPLEEIDYMELRFGKGEDFYRSFTWKNDSGTVIAVQNAYMQAVNSSGTTVLDLRWYTSAPSESTIEGLTGNRRGYIAPVANETMLVHISNTNTIAAGEYSFDIFVQDGAGDWSRLTKGSLVVEPSVSVKP